MKDYSISKIIIALYYCKLSVNNNNKAIIIFDILCFDIMKKRIYNENLFY